jgi:hypothetical protein
MRTNKRILSEAKRDLELAIVKCLSHAPLRPAELTELLAVSEADLMRDHGCDLYMAEQVKQHTKREQYRMRAQNHFTRAEDASGLYPEKPYTRTSPINESHEGRMLDYGHTASDSREGRMARGALRNIAVDAYRLYQLLNDEDDLPQWCEYKIAQAQLMMNSVREYLEYKLESKGEDMPGELEVFVGGDFHE